MFVDDLFWLVAMIGGAMLGMILCIGLVASAVLTELKRIRHELEQR